MERKRLRLAAYAVAIEDTRILLARIAPGNDGAGKWTLPGGGVEWGEHPEATLVREVHEETGLVVGGYTLMGINSAVFGHGAKQLHAVRMIYDVPLSGPPTVVEVDGSVDAAAWIPIADLTSVPTVELVGVGLDLR